ncbi:hypothetical protein AB3R30_05305 [Leptolyngbyaceae cyanobacterium UHCC 1019]
MTVRQPRYSKEEFAHRGGEIYELRVRSRPDLQTLADKRFSRSQGTGTVV